MTSDLAWELASS